MVQKTEESLKTQGVSYFIYPATREEDFMRAMNETQLRVRNLRYVNPFKDSDPNFFLVSMDFASLEAQKLRPLILYEKKGDYGCMTNRMIVIAKKD